MTETKDKEPGKSFDEKNLPALLQNHSNLRIGQDQVLWNIFGAFWATHGLLLVSIFSAENFEKHVGWVISLIGSFVSLIWTLIQNRAIKRIKIYEKAIEKIETQLVIDDNLKTFKKGQESIFAARNIMEISAIGSIILWAIAFLIFFIHFLYSMSACTGHY